MWEKTLYALFAGSERSGESADDKDQLSTQPELVKEQRIEEQLHA